MENIQKEKWSELLDRFHEDESLRARIDGGETPEVLREFGIPIPEGVEARVVEDTDDVTHVIFRPIRTSSCPTRILPPSPAARPSARPPAREPRARSSVAWVVSDAPAA